MPVTTARLDLRPATEADRPFLLRVYGSTRADELARVDWTDAAKEAFVAMQFDAQDRHYRQHYPEASYDVVTVDGRPAGRLYVDRRAGDVRIVDIALLPEFRGAGAGSTLIRRLQDGAAAAGSTLSIHVEVFNPARRLYHRLGFVEVGHAGAHVLMEWRPPEGTAS